MNKIYKIISNNVLFFSNTIKVLKRLNFSQKGELISVEEYINNCVSPDDIDFPSVSFLIDPIEKCFELSDTLYRNREQGYDLNKLPINYTPRGIKEFESFINKIVNN